MVGSALFSILSQRGMSEATILKVPNVKEKDHSQANPPQNCLLMIATTMAICCVTTRPGATNIDTVVSFLAFLLLEIAIGMYFPAISYLRWDSQQVWNWFSWNKFPQKPSHPRVSSSKCDELVQVRAEELKLKSWWNKDQSPKHSPTFSSWPQSQTFSSLPESQTFPNIPKHSPPDQSPDEHYHVWGPALPPRWRDLQRQEDRLWRLPPLIWTWYVDHDHARNMLTYFCISISICTWIFPRCIPGTKVHRSFSGSWWREEDINCEPRWCKSREGGVMKKYLIFLSRFPTDEIFARWYGHQTNCINRLLGHKI